MIKPRLFCGIAESSAKFYGDIGAVEATKYALWLQRILEEMRVPQIRPIRIYCNSQICMAMAF